jgi:hypothetical protein
MNLSTPIEASRFRVRVESEDKDNQSEDYDPDPDPDPDDIFNPHRDSSIVNDSTNR